MDDTARILACVNDTGEIHLVPLRHTFFPNLGEGSGLISRALVPSLARFVAADRGSQADRGTTSAAAGLASGLLATNDLFALRQVATISTLSNLPRNSVGQITCCTWWRTLEGEPQLVLGTNTGVVLLFALHTQTLLHQFTAQAPPRHPGAPGGTNASAAQPAATTLSIRSLHIVTDRAQTQRALILCTQRNQTFVVILETRDREHGHQTIHGFHRQHQDEKERRGPAILSALSKRDRTSSAEQEDLRTTAERAEMWTAQRLAHLSGFPANMGVVQDFAKGGQLVAVFSQQTQHLELYDSSLLENKFPLFQFQLSFNTVMAHSTEHLFFAFQAPKPQLRTPKLLVVSKLLSGTSTTAASWLLHDNRQEKGSVFQEFCLPPEHRSYNFLPGFRFRRTPTVPNSGRNGAASPVLMEENEFEEEGLFIWTEDTLYELRERNSPCAIFYELLERDAFAEALNFGKTFGLDMVSLYEAAADRYFRAKNYHKAFQLYSLSSASEAKLVQQHLLANRVESALQYLIGAVVHNSARVPLAKRGRLSDLLLMLFLARYGFPPNLPTTRHTPNSGTPVIRSGSSSLFGPSSGRETPTAGTTTPGPEPSALLAASWAESHGTQSPVTAGDLLEAIDQEQEFWTPPPSETSEHMTAISLDAPSYTGLEASFGLDANYGIAGDVRHVDHARDNIKTLECTMRSIKNLRQRAAGLDPTLDAETFKSDSSNNKEIVLPSFGEVDHGPNITADSEWDDFRNFLTTNADYNPLKAATHLISRGLILLALYVFHAHSFMANGLRAIAHHGTAPLTEKCLQFLLANGYSEHVISVTHGALFRPLHPNQQLAVLTAAASIVYIPPAHPLTRVTDDYSGRDRSASNASSSGSGLSALDEPTTVAEAPPTAQINGPRFLDVVVAAIGACSSPSMLLKTADCFDPRHNARLRGAVGSGSDQPKHYERSAYTHPSPVGTTEGLEVYFAAMLRYAQLLEASLNNAPEPLSTMTATPTKEGKHPTNEPCGGNNPAATLSTVQQRLVRYLRQYFPYYRPCVVLGHCLSTGQLLCASLLHELCGNWGDAMRCRFLRKVVPCNGDAEAGSLYRQSLMEEFLLVLREASDNGSSKQGKPVPIQPGGGEKRIAFSVRELLTFWSEAHLPVGPLEEFLLRNLKECPALGDALCKFTLDPDCNEPVPITFTGKFLSHLTSFFVTNPKSDTGKTGTDDAQVRRLLSQIDTNLRSDAIRNTSVVTPLADFPNLVGKGRPVLQFSCGHAVDKDRCTEQLLPRLEKAARVKLSSAAVRLLVADYGQQFISERCPQCVIAKLTS
eukprot:TRINITY_DN4065_c0_g1_i1.p1 TRINITY_DN4065_c0_g1~~TRINITY_DN4065_c0_g1_i1.p1  ORF type:complete len:1428 (+),score=197.81 TRINITY_DN4065_c0_g1_i1:368-4285(+)